MGALDSEERFDLDGMCNDLIIVLSTESIKLRSE